MKNTKMAEKSLQPDNREKAAAAKKADANPNKYPSPLHEIGQMHEDIATRLAWAEEALATRGEGEVNALDGGTDWRTSRGRPLHAALSLPGNVDQWTGERRARFESLDLLRFLLDRGADPRLRDARGLDTPADLARWELRTRADDDPSRGFYEQAIQMLEEAAKKIEGECLILYLLTPSISSYLQYGEANVALVCKDKERSSQGVTEKLKGALGLGGDERDVDCLFCREGKRHNYHYMCYAGTQEECRTLEAVDRIVKPQF